MDEPNAAVELEITRRLQELADRERRVDDSLERRIDALEKWKAAGDATSALRRWLFPIILSVVSSVGLVIGLVLTLTHKS
jgi:hypothetical protein